MLVEHVNVPHSFVAYRIYCDVDTEQYGYVGNCGRPASNKYVDLTGNVDDKYLCDKHYNKWAKDYA